MFFICISINAYLILFQRFEELLFLNVSSKYVIQINFFGLCLFIFIFLKFII